MSLPFVGSSPTRPRCRPSARHGMLVALVLTVLPYHSTRADGPADSFRDQVIDLYDTYLLSFGSRATGLVYHHRLDGPEGIRALSPPSDIARGEVRGQPMPYGYGSGIQDVALENGQLLFALCEAAEATGDSRYADRAGRLFRAMRRLASVSPEPGFVPRGPHPDGKSYYRDSSRDQHATYSEALWRYGRSRLATDDDRSFIAATLRDMARRMERHEWRIMVEDNSHQAHVGFTWAQQTSVGAVTLLSFLAQVKDATQDPHWQSLYDRFSADREQVRWNRWLHPRAVEQWPPLTLYAQQFCQAMVVLRRIETNVDRRRQLDRFLQLWAQRAVDANVFDTRQWRRLDWAGRRTEPEIQTILSQLHLTTEKPRTAVELFRAAGGAAWKSSDGTQTSVAQKLCYGLATVPLHAALLSGDDDLVTHVAPTVRQMVRDFQTHHRQYLRGENFNRTVILGLLLDAHPNREAPGRSHNLRADPSSEPGPQSEHGPESEPASSLTIAGTLGTGPSIDVAVVANLAYVIGRGKMSIVDVADPLRPNTLGRVNDLGNTRQLVVQDQTAYIASREDGLFVVDVRSPARPRRVAHYDSIEWATGLAISGDVLAIACRHFGVELVDVSQPDRPMHLSTLRTGEAQSVAICDGRLYVGVWAASKVVVADIRDPRQPSVLGHTPLDGYGDGVDVRDGYLYAATGHHARGPHRSPEDPAYGRGHGLEIFRLDDPAHPVLAGRVKFPPFYQMGNDMWSVTVSGKRAFVADTHNGVFVVDVGHPDRPKVIARQPLPIVSARGQADFVGGLAVTKNFVLAAGGWTDTYVMKAHGLAELPAPAPDRPVVVPAAQRWEPDSDRYRPPGQVHAVAVRDDVAVAACGSAGIHVIDVGDRLTKIAAQPTKDFATDVCIRGSVVYVAEGIGGLSLWQLGANGHLTPIGRYTVPGRRIRYVAVPSPGRYALVEVGQGRLHIVDLSDPAHPIMVLDETRPGLLYGHQLLDELVDRRFAAVFWHVSGLHWYDLRAEPPVAVGQRQTGRFSPRSGLAMFGDQVMTTRRGGLVVFDRGRSGPLDERPVLRVPGQSLQGQITVTGQRVVLADRAEGTVTVIDLADPTAPKLVTRFTSAGNPGRVLAIGHELLVPDGNAGLVRRRLEAGDDSPTSPKSR